MTTRPLPAAALTSMDPVRRFLSANLFCAIRDSVNYPQPPSKTASKNTRNCANYQLRKAAADREDARNWIRAKGMSNDRKGHGFGYVWESLEYFGVINFHIDRFVEEMERIWDAADNNHDVGKRLIHLMHNITIENGVSASNISRRKLRSRRAA